MRFRHKKIFISGVAVTVAGVLGVGALLHTSVSVQASSAMMPGIETIVSETSKAEPFRILEIVDDTKDAEIGYYVSGQEPYIKLYEYTPDDGSQPIHFSSLEEGLSQLPTRELRQEFANNIKISHNEDGSTNVAASEKIRDVREICYRPGQTDPGQGNEITEYPLTYEEYQECYFLDPGETEEQALANGWKIVDLAETRTDVIKGYYQPNSAGTGNYTKQKQSYYPIREEKRNGDNADGASTAKYRENIQNFFSGESVSSGAPYNLVFEPVDNNTVNSAFADNKKGAELQKEYDYANGAYGYYENVYGDLTQSIVEGIEKGHEKGQYTFPGETSDPEAKTGELISTNEQLNSAKERFTSDTFDDGALSNDAMISDGDMEVYNGQVPADTQPSQNTSPSGDIQYENNTDDFSTGEVGSSMMGMSYVNGMDYTVMNATYGGQGYSAMKTSFEDDFSSEAGGFGDDSYTESQDPYSYGVQEPYTYEQNETVTAPFSQSEGENTDENDVQASEENHGTVWGETEKAGTQADPYVYIGESIFEYPYYKYTPVGDLKYVKDCVVKEQDNKTEEGEPITRKEGDITVDEAGQYWYWKKNETTDIVEKQPLSIVTHRQAVAFKDIRTISEDITYNYYYRVKEVYFCCKGIEIKEENGTTTIDTSTPNSFTYYGWYYPTYPANEEIYLEIGEGDTHVPTYYISEPSYTLTPGKGNYDFIPSKDDPNAKEQAVEVNRIYYKGGYTNHDWLKRYVFHLSPDGEDGDTEEEKQQAAAEFNNFDIKVDTVTADKLSLDGTVTTTEADEVSAAAFYAEGDTEAFADDPEAKMQDVSSDTVDFQLDGSTEDEVTESEIIEGENASGQIPEAQSLEGQIAEGETSEVEPMVSESQEEMEFFEDFDSAGEPFDGDETDEAGFASEENTDEVTFFADSDSVEVAAVGSSGDSGNLPLSEYDLIYINTSRLNEEQAQVLVNLADNGTACIINQGKMTADNNAVYTAFAAYLKNTEEDADQHYVTHNVYFFKDLANSSGEATEGNTEETTDGEPDSDTSAGFYLVNLNFHKVFYSETEDENGFTDGTATAYNPVQGFEEILEYIKSENQYRSIGSSNTDSSDIDATGSKTGSGFVSNKVDLLTMEISQARAVEYILNYKYKRAITTKSEINVLEIEPAKVSDNNKLKKSEVRRWLGYDNVGYDVTACSQETVKEDGKIDNMLDRNWDSIWHTRYQDNGNEKKCSYPHWIKIEFDTPQVVSGVVYVPRQKGDNGKFQSFKIRMLDKDGKILYNKDETIEVENPESSDEKRFEFKVEEGKPISNVKTIELMEIYGINDFASCAELYPVYENSADFPKVNITTMTASEYVGHIDDISSKYDMIYIGDSYDTRDKLIMGDDPTLYTHVGGVVLANDLKYAYGKKYNLLGMMDFDYYSINEKTADVTLRGKNESVTLTQGLVRTGYNENGVGSFRGSGNDMTQQQLDELLDFVKSGYPVIIADDLVENNAVNIKTVDNSSYYYEFIDQALKYKNVVQEGNLSNQKESLSFFSNLSKPQIDFSEGKYPPDAPRATATAEEKDDPNNYLPESGLEYEFVVRNDSDAFPANTTYDCNLYLDLNFDGNLSDSEGQGKYIEIRDEDNHVLQTVDGKYYLKIGGKYTLTRKIPYDYYKIITWKLELVSNTNENVKTSVMGYTKRKRNTDAKDKINILQITPNTGIIVPGSHGTWNLATDNRLKDYLEKVDDFQLVFKEMTVTEYVEAYNTNKNLLDEYQMVILGFDDMVENIPSDGAVKAIVNFIKAGKSVIFAHDTTSNINWDYRTTDLKTDDKKYSGGIDNWIWNVKNTPDWGYNLNKFFRSISGLDRYGITNINYSVSDGSKATISELLKKGEHLTDGETVNVKGENVQVDFDRLNTLVGDVAYTTGSNRKTSYLQTQGYNNIQLQSYGYAGDSKVTKVTKVNDGAITQYPYVIPDTISVSETHGQYYQLAMEKDLDINGNHDGKNDVVVWYCLSDSVYATSPNDVRNNYYFYSNGNVIYTGAGHSTGVTDQEIQLFINAMVAAANVTAVQPEVKFVKNLNPAAEIESVRYYMTDQAQYDGSGNVLENDMDFYFTVRDYNMVSASISLEDQQKEDMTVQFFIQSEGENASGLTPEDGIGETVPEGNYENITKEVGPLTQYGSKNIVEIGSDGQFHLSQNSAYGFKIQDIEKYLYSQQEQKYTSSCPIYVRVTSTVTLYGKQTKKATWAKLDLKQRQLFDLD